MAKFNFKQAVVNHTEKVVFGLVMLFVLWGLVSTDWSAYSGTPHDIRVKAEACKKNIQQAVWPEEERATYQLTDAKRPVNEVRNELFASINPGDYEASRPMFLDGLAPKKPITEIGKNRPEQLIASAARVLIEIPLVEEDAEADGDLAMAAEAEAEVDPDLPDEFRDRKTPVGGGAAGYGDNAAEMMGLEYAAPDAYDPTMGSDSASYAAGYGGGEYATEGGMTMAATAPKREGKGYSFVSVRAVFKVRDQISKFAESMGVSYHEAARYFYIIDFVLERQAIQPGQAPVDGQWETVDIKVAEDVLNEAVGFDADPVNSMIVDPVITMPLPMRLTGAWERQATHPAIAKFVLTPEQVELEMELNSLMIQKAIEQRKAVKTTGVQRKGFAGNQFSAGDAMAGMMGGGSAYDSYAMMGSNMMGSGMAGPGGGAAMRPGRPAPKGAGAQPEGPQRLDQLLDDLVGKEDKERRERLREWIQTRAKAEGELLLFRYIDFAVTPGKTYCYRVKFVIPNPNFGRRIADAGGEASVVEGETRETDWSEVTEPVTVPKEMQYYLTAVKAPTFNAYNKIFPTANWEAFQYDREFGTIVNGKLELRHGQKVADKVTTEVIKPGESFYDREEYSFKSDDFVGDILGDLPLDPAFHGADPDTAIKPIRGARGQMLAQGQALLMTAEGPMMADTYSRQKELATAVAYQKSQAEHYAKIKEAQEKLAMGGAGGSEYDPYGGAGGDMEMMMSMGGGSGPRQRNVLRKSAKPGASGSRSSSSSSRSPASGTRRQGGSSAP